MATERRDELQYLTPMNSVRFYLQTSLKRLEEKAMSGRLRDFDYGNNSIKYYKEIYLNHGQTCYGNEPFNTRVLTQKPSSVH